MDDVVSLTYTMQKKRRTEPFIEYDPESSWVKYAGLGKVHHDTTKFCIPRAVITGVDFGLGEARLEFTAIGEASNTGVCP